MRKLLMMLVMVLAFSQTSMAQRFTDNLDRGLVAVPTGSAGNSSSNLVSWRRLANEYYNVTYNLYKNGSRVASNLTTTTYADASSATSTTRYQVAAVVNGVEQTQSTAVTPWTQYVYKIGDNRYPTAYLDIDLATVYDRTGADVTANYQPNDAEMADLDGDGQLEIIIKRLNTVDAAGIYLETSKEFVVLDAYDVNWQTGAATLMWRIDCGPNMASMNSTEINIIAYDWDEDGKAEVVLRGADNMIVYGTDGKTQLYTIGDMLVNTRNEMTSHTNSQYAWTHTGAEYLIYMNGQTGALYQKTDYPLKRLESGESNEKSAWGDNYGHRSTKHFLGAPVLDGRNASLFLARGIYTRHKMIAMDLDRGSHQWTERWRWNNNSKSSPWYGQGNHNYVIADVDEDGRDEIVYGSMVIDDNGKGLSTTGLGHGDAMHVSDFNPWRKGLEVFACNEEKPNMNYRDATTSEILYRSTGSSDDGRGLMANFSNDYPGAQGRSVHTNVISSASYSEIAGMEGDSYINWGDLNYRIYWDGDLCSEILNSPGTAREAKVEKPGTGRLFTSSGCNMNNDSKNNPCFQGDIIGDWREEIVVRRGTGLRVYTTGLNTNYSLPSLWFDHQYRQAMVWQMMAYNQPPHLSYFLGEMEGITIAPPPLTTRGRTEISNGGSITASNNGQHVLLCDVASVGIASAGVSPEVITVNVNAVVSGNDNNSNITTNVKTTQLGFGSDKGDISGTARLVKQGNGQLNLTAREFSYSGATDIWGGTLRFRGTLTNSDVWMNRHTSFFSGATIKKSLTMEYGSTLYPTDGDVSNASTASYGTTTVGTLNLHEGARIVLQLDPANSKFDQLNIGTLNIRKRSGEAWEKYGPKLLKPVIEIQALSSLSNTTYVLGTLDAIGEGELSDIILEGAGGDSELSFEGGKLVLKAGSEKVTAPVVTGEGRIKTVIPGESSLGSDVAVYYTTTASANPVTEGTKLDKNYVKMPNETTYYFYTVSSGGAVSVPVEVYFDGWVTETYDFAAIATEAGSINATLSDDAITQETSGAKVYQAAYGTYILGNRFATSKSRRNNSVYQDWWIRSGNGWNCLLTYTGNQNTYYLSLLNLKDGDKVTFYISNGELTLLSSNVTGMDVNGKLASGTEYTISTTDESTHLDLSGIGKSTRITKVLIKTQGQNEVVGQPAVEVLASNGGTRTIGITPGAGNQGTAATETYYTTDGSDPADESNVSRFLYTKPFDVTASCTIKAVSYIIEETSSTTSVAVEAGSPLTLVAPFFTKTDYVNGEYSVTISSNQSSLVVAPSEVIYYYAIDGGEMMRFGEGTFIKVAAGSKLTAYTVAEGYADSETSEYTLDVLPMFTNIWNIDFTKIESTSYAETKLGSYTMLKDNNGAILNENFGVPGSGEGNDKAYIHNGGLYMMFSGYRDIAIQADEGQYVRVIVDGLVNGSSTGLQKSDLSYGNCYIYKVTSTGINTISLARYSVVHSVEVLDMVTVTKTITNAGWATYCSSYALEFSKPIANLTQAYLVTGVEANGTTLKLEPVNSTVPAGTGILLQGEGECVIPVASFSPTNTDANKLVGVLEQTNKDAGSVYVLLQENGVTGFYRNNKTFTVGAQTAYLPCDFGTANSRFYSLFGETTGIDDAAINNKEENNKVFYNLSGQRFNKPVKGLYIVNGKKVVIK